MVLKNMLDQYMIPMKSITYFRTVQPSGSRVMPLFQNIYFLSFQVIQQIFGSFALYQMYT